MSGGDDEATTDADGEPVDVTDEAQAAAGEGATAVAEPVVIDLRDGVDTIAAHEADQAERARRAAAARARR